MTDESAYSMSVHYTLPHVSGKEAAIFTDSGTRRIATFSGRHHLSNARRFLSALQFVETVIMQANGDLNDADFRAYVTRMASQI